MICWMLKANHHLKCADSESDRLILSLPKYDKISYNEIPYFYRAIAINCYEV